MPKTEVDSPKQERPAKVQKHVEFRDKADGDSIDVPPQYTHIYELEFVDHQKPKITREDIIECNCADGVGCCEFDCELHDDNIECSLSSHNGIDCGN